VNYTIVIRRVATGAYVASCPAVPECHAQGDTYEECLANAKEALELCIEYMRDKGIALPEEVGRETVAIAP
jgi:predicted RNase H-like HicB family nuclease